MTITELYQIILTRKSAMAADSYVASLFASGTDRIAQKVGEEAVEVVIAAKNSSKERLVSESADLLFHWLVLLADKNIDPADVLQELENRAQQRNKAL